MCYGLVTRVVSISHKATKILLIHLISYKKVGNIAVNPLGDLQKDHTTQFLIRLLRLAVLLPSPPHGNGFCWIEGSHRDTEASKPNNDKVLEEWENKDRQHERPATARKLPETIKSRVWVDVM
jgi:hypothetical protein